MKENIRLSISAFNQSWVSLTVTLLRCHWLTGCVCVFVCVCFITWSDSYGFHFLAQGTWSCSGGAGLQCRCFCALARTPGKRSHSDWSQCLTPGRHSPVPVAPFLPRTVPPPVSGADWSWYSPSACPDQPVHPSAFSRWGFQSQTSCPQVCWVWLKVGQPSHWVDCYFPLWRRRIRKHRNCPWMSWYNPSTSIDFFF